MEKSEPTLVPEWLRSSTGSITGGGSSATHFASSSSHSDFSSLANHTRNRNSKSTSDFVDNPRLGLLDRTSSSNSRRSSSNGSAKHAYSSFSRGNRDRDREKERSSFSNHWESDSLDPIGNILAGRGERSLLQRSQSLLSRKQGNTFPQKVGVDIRNGNHSNTKNNNAPPKARATPELSVKTQRLEELAIKQSRQLIPVTPSIAKGSSLSLSDKTKPKTTVRSNEMSLTPKAAQQQPSSPFIHANNNQSIGGGVVKTDPPKTKLLVLKPGRQNGVSNHNKDAVSSPTSNANNSSRASNNQPVVAPPPSRSPKIASSGERKAAILSGFSVDKKPTVLQTQKSRNDFFNLIKKKTSSSNASSHSASVQMEKSETATNKVVTGENSHTIENGVSNGDKFEGGDKSTIERAYPNEEEVAFLRSLGWDENSGEDEGLTEEEINAFRQQYMMKPVLKRGIEPKLPESHTTSLGGQSILSSSDSESESEKKVELGVQVVGLGSCILQIVLKLQLP
ncbi:hypothetical protein ACFE04_012165 [Oxalis oulophora]